MKKKIPKIPKRFNYVEAYLTFRCDLGCDYCINAESGVIRNRKELSAVEWLEALDKIGFHMPLTLGGGEPTQHRDFYDLVDLVNTPIDLLTNLQFNTDEFIFRVDPNKFSKSDVPFYHSIRASFHPTRMDKKDTLKRARKLIDNGFNVGLFGIMHPYQINDNMEMSFLAQKEGVPFYVKDFLGRIGQKMFGYFKYPEGVDGFPKTANCRSRELLIAPDGQVYRCHRDLYHAQGAIGDIRDLQIKDEFRPCTNYGLCNPCDVKAKTNRFLKGVECQVEIK